VVDDGELCGGKPVILFEHSRVVPWSLLYPRLTLWAAFFRRFAAAFCGFGIRKSRACFHRSKASGISPVWFVTCVLGLNLHNSHALRVPCQISRLSGDLNHFSRVSQR
jgi:hypothetical protein